MTAICLFLIAADGVENMVAGGTQAVNANCNRRL